MGKLFGTDGIRGKANTYPMDTKTALAVGGALGRFFNTGKSGAHIIVALDTRISGDMLAMSVGAGICSSGLNVSLAGILPTPGLARMVVEDPAAVAGVVISASHNPFDDNGIKVFNGHGYKLSEAVESQIETLIEEVMNQGMLHTDHIGRVRHCRQAAEKYLDFLVRSVPGLSLDGMSIILDCANGATFKTAPQAFEKLGARVESLFCEPNGININDHCGSQYPETMAKAVIDQKADLGLAFDGDGDRLIAVDDRGRVLSGDQIMAVCARDLQQKGKLNKNIVVSTVMSNIGFHKALKNIGIQTLTTSVGDRFVIEKMREEGAIIGGEDSGHIIFHDAHTTGDGILAALRLLDAIKSAGRPLSQLSEIITVYPQTLINVRVKEKPSLETIPEIVTAIKQVESTLGDSGRVLVRYSGTENKCRVMVEGPTESETARYGKQIADVVSELLG
jgi:phosphoglucosamine mutase